MKKYSLLIIVLIILVGLVSCNLDPETGIYRSISEASEITDIRVTHALGYENDKAYFLSDDGLYSKENGNEAVKLVNSAILAASFTNDKNDILFLKNTDSDGTDVFSYNINSETSTSRTADVYENTKMIFNNSFFITQDGDDAIVINYIETTASIKTYTPTSSITNITKVLTSEDSILVLGTNDSDDYIAELYIYSSPSITMSTIDYNNYIGFEYYDSGYILIDEDKEVYNNNVDTEDSIEATVSDLYSSQLASFSVGSYVYFKGEDYFHRVLSDGTNKALNLGFATKLQYDIIDVLPEGTDNTFIVFTLESGVFKLSGVDTSVDSSGTVTQI